MPPPASTGVAAPPERVTHHPDAHEQLLYFTSPSLTRDDESLVFISDRTGHPNLFRRELSTGREWRLSDNRDGWLKSYVYFDGTPYRGFGKASVCLHADSGRVFFLQGRDVVAAEPDGGARVLATYPDGQTTAFTHVSADGRWLCVPTTDARALDGDRRFPAGLGPDYDIDARVQAEGLDSWLRVYDAHTGVLEACHRLSRAWVTHVQFAPHDAGLILYNHEWPADCGVRRVWLYGPDGPVALRTESADRSRDDWTCHEMWEHDGGAVIYHGKKRGGRPYVGRVVPGQDPTEINLPPDYTPYGHFTAEPDGVLITDGHYVAPGEDVPPRGAWVCRVEVDWSAGSVRWCPLCRSGSSWSGQDAHPHPVLDHAGRYVYFTSDVDGRRAVYRVPADTRGPDVS